MALKDRPLLAFQCGRGYCSGGRDIATDSIYTQEASGISKYTQMVVSDCRFTVVAGVFSYI